MATGFPATLLSVMVIAAFALASGGAWLILRRRDLGKGLLMLAAAVVLIGNVLVWTL